jgi:hypothetical protein
VTETSGSDDSGSSDDSSSSSSDDSSGSGSDSSDSGRDDSSSSGVEVEIEHGIMVIKAHEVEHRSNLSSSSSGTTDSSRQSSDSAEIATTSLRALISVNGSSASQLAEHAKTIEDSLSHFSADENAIRTRNGIVIFFFGGDKSAASDIETHINEVRVALDKMDKIVNDPTTSPALKSFTQERIATIRAELERLKSIAETEKQKRGLFGYPRWDITRDRHGIVSPTSIITWMLEAHSLFISFSDRYQFPWRTWCDDAHRSDRG